MREHGILIQKIRKEKGRPPYRENWRGKSKGLLERLMVEERAIYWKSIPSRPGYYINPLRPHRRPESSRVRKGGFRQAIFPKQRKASLRPAEANSVLYAAGILGGNLRVLLLGRRGNPEYYAIHLHHPPHPGEKRPRSRFIWPLGLSPWTKGDSSRRGKRSELGMRYSSIFGGAGWRRSGSILAMSFRI